MTQEEFQHQVIGRLIDLKGEASDLKGEISELRGKMDNLANEMNVRFSAMSEKIDGRFNALKEGPL